MSSILRSALLKSRPAFTPIIISSTKQSPVSISKRTFASVTNPETREASSGLRTPSSDEVLNDPEMERPDRAGGIPFAYGTGLAETLGNVEFR